VFGFLPTAALPKNHLLKQSGLRVSRRPLCIEMSYETSTDDAMNPTNATNRMK
jgi:hypothetical protein